MSFLKRDTLKLIAAAGLCLITGTAQAQYQGQSLTVASFGGKVDEVYRKALAGFEQKFGVTIRWVPGTATENAAKVVATRGRPDFDVAMMDDIAMAGLSKRGGLLVPLDPKIMTNYDDMRPQAKFPSKDGVPLGFNFTGIFYNPEEFRKRGWAPPQSWDDLFRPEFCHNIGIMDASLSYTTHMLLLLAGGDASKVPQSIKKLSRLKSCLPTLEPSSAKLEEKIQLGEYIVGVHGTVRVVPLGAAGYPVRLVIPKEGTVLSSTTAVAVAGGNEKLALEFLNWIVSAPAQEILLREAFYVPANSKVNIPDEMLKIGMPSPNVIDSALDVDRAAVAAQRRDWAREFTREVAP